MCCYFDQVFLVEQILNFSETDLVEVKVERYFLNGRKRKLNCGELV